MTAPAIAAVRALGLDPHAAAHALVNRIAAARGLPAPWDAPEHDLPVLESVEQIGEVHQALLGDQDGTRGAQGSYYTPDPLAQFMSRFVMDVNLSRLDGRHPLDTVVLDPACGAGVILVRAARDLTTQLVQVEAGAVRDDFVRAWMPYVMRDCIFGIDIDPVAVDLAKSALWLEIEGAEPITWMDRNIICGNALDGDEPPALRERCAVLGLAVPTRLGDVLTAEEV